MEYDIKRLRECSGALRAEVARMLAGRPDRDDGLDALRAVLDIGDEWRNSRPKDANIHYSDMIAHMGNAYGDIGALLALLGQANQRIGGGGVEQYFQSGYASVKDHGFPKKKPDIGPHMKLVKLFGEYLRGLNAWTETLHSLLNDIGNRLESHMEELEKHVDDCPCCGIHLEKPELWADDLDRRWNSDELNVDARIRALVDDIFAI